MSAAQGIPLDEYPGLTILARQALDRALDGNPKEVGIGILFAFHFGEEPGGLGWVANCRREDSISMVTEWLRQQVREGHGEVVKAAFDRWFKKNEGPR